MNVRTLRLRRGQAATELAVSTVFIVPIVLYSLFLDDMLRYKLDLMEAVTMAPWDATVMDYQKAQEAGNANINGNVTRMTRLNWCDHTTAYNSYDSAYDCGAGDQPAAHHSALAAHACWIVAQKDGEKNQVQCTLDTSAGQEPFGSAIATMGLAGAVNAGGMVSCSARLGVVNYFLWDNSLSPFSDQVLSGQKRYGTAGSHAENVHGDAKGQSTVWLLERQRAAVITDTWALTTRDAVQPGGPPTNGPLTKRVDAATSKIPAGLGMAFGAQLVAKQLLNPLAMIDGPMGHMLLTTSVAWSPDLPPRVNNFYSSPWTPTQTSQVHSSRGTYYMGLQQPPN